MQCFIDMQTHERVKQKSNKIFSKMSREHLSIEILETSIQIQA